jgi:hypothetical protein
MSLCDTHWSKNRRINHRPVRINLEIVWGFTTIRIAAGVTYRRKIQFSARRPVGRPSPIPPLAGVPNLGLAGNGKAPADTVGKFS